jgi:hypothetical protein
MRWWLVPGASVGEERGQSGKNGELTRDCRGPEEGFGYRGLEINGLLLLDLGVADLHLLADPGREVLADDRVEDVDDVLQGVEGQQKVKSCLDKKSLKLGASKKLP